ncbi:MAG: cell division protein SepF [Kineosporiaceae bacterium]|nr:cell division protein SepF [Kineosporiaceae bacterium]
MAGALRKTMVYLGLAEDEERYDAYDVDEDFPDDDATPDQHDEEPARRSREVEHLEERRAPVTPIRGQLSRVVSSGQGAGDLHRISTIHPRTYNEAKIIGEAFRAGTPVIMNLSDMDDSDAKRLVDFAAGLVFGLHGSIERVTSKVFLLSPSHVEVAPAEKVKVPERAFFNQS